MKKLLPLLAFIAWAGFYASPADAQCIGVGGVNSVPQPGVTCASEPAVNSYAATSVALVPVAAGATDFFCLGGSATKVVRLQRLRIAGTATTIVSVPLLIMKHASLDTGAASATGTQIPIPYALDSTDLAPTAVTRAWITANPTITDAAPGIIGSANLQLNLPAAVSTNVIFDWDNHNFVEAITLRKATEEVCLNLNTTAVTAGLLYITAIWTEAPQ
jgi:hypothetical protein